MLKLFLIILFFITATFGSRIVHAYRLRKTQKIKPRFLWYFNPMSTKEKADKIRRRITLSQFRLYRVTKRVCEKHSSSILTGELAVIDKERCNICLKLSTIK